MQTWRTSNGMLLIGLAASVIAHIVVLFPALVSVLSKPDDHVLLLRASFEEEAYRPRPEEPEREVHLGLEESPHFSPNIIGYDEYQKHVAPVADVEQPDLSIQDPGSPAAQAQPSEVAQPPVETPTPAEPLEVEPFDFKELFEAMASGQAREAAIESDRVAQPDAPESETPKIETPTELISRLLESPTQEPPTKPDDVPADELAAASDTEQPAEPVKPQPEAPPEASPPKPETKPAPPTEQPKPSEKPPADLDSDAFSIEVPLENMKTGKPVAGKGIEIKPVKPHQELFQRLTSAPGNPLVEIQFGKDHKPRRCFIRRSSGDTRFDEALRNSLYRWRAIGEEIDKLEGDETVTIRLEIALIERRR